MSDNDIKRLESIISATYFNFYKMQSEYDDGEKDIHYVKKSSNHAWFDYLKKHGISTNGDFPLLSDEFWNVYKNDDFVIVYQPGFGARWASIPIEYARQILDLEEKILVLGGLP